MTRLKPLIAGLATGLTSLLAATPAMAELEESLHLKVTKIVDPSGFEKPMVAATSVIPQDWESEGGVIWRITGTCQSGSTTDWTATSADGRAMIRMLPGAGWQYNSQGFPVAQDCIPYPVKDAPAYVQGFIQQLDSAEIVETERDPATQAVLSQPPFTYEMKGDPYTRAWWDAASISFDYKREGEPYTAVMIVFTMHNHTVTGHSFGSPLEMGYGMAVNQILISAPSDELMDHMPAFYLFLKNFRQNPDYVARIQKASRRPNKPAPAMPDLSETYDEISDITMSGWETRNAIREGSTRETSEWIRGVETFDASTPTGQIELPSGFDRAFQMDDDSFVVTNDQFFDPMNGRELTVTQ